MKYPNLNEEKKLWEKGYKKVVGIDEAGRGSLAGPVFAAAVILKPRIFANETSRIFANKLASFGGIKDSKQLAEKKREEAYKALIKNPNIEWTTSKVSEKVIDKINIKNATELAMERCVQKFKIQNAKCKIDYLIVDGNRLKSKKLKKMEHKMIINADEKVFSCAAASIIAKVRRDRLMQKMHKRYPRYGFDNNKGYGTKFHKERIKKSGFCKIHRRSFNPIKNTIEKF